MEDNYTLIIKEVSASSAGKYRCKIENQYGSNESTADLTVLCKLMFLGCALDYILCIIMLMYTNFFVSYVEVINFFYVELEVNWQIVVIL